MDRMNLTTSCIARSCSRALNAFALDFPQKMLLLAASTSACRIGCASGPADHAPRTMAAPLQHVVVVDLTDDADIPAMRAASDALMATIPWVKGYVCGAPVDIGRANVATDYDLAIIVQFDSVEDYRRYLEDPRHLELVATWRSKWARSYIIDFAP